jgi:hypothetical protein
MSNQKIKKYFLYYLKENVLIFDVSCYIDEMAIHVIDFVYDWKLIKNDVVNCSQKLIKELIHTKITLELNCFLETAKDNNCKIICVLIKDNKEKNWWKYFDEYQKFIKICKRNCKAMLPNFKQIDTDKKFFVKTKGTFLDFPCLIPSGDDQEFIESVLDKLK